MGARRGGRPRTWGSALLFAVALCAAAQDVDWSQNGGRDNIRYTTLKQITPANVSRLKMAWRWDSHDEFKDSEMQVNPVVVDGLLYATTPKMRVVARRKEKQTAAPASELDEVVEDVKRIRSSETAKAVEPAPAP